MTPDEFDERWAHWYVEPWGKEMEIASAVGAEILNAIRQATATEKVPEDELIKPDHFLPKLRSDSPKSEGGGFSSVMRARIGV